MIFNYYNANIKDSTPLGIVSLNYVLNAIKNPKINLRNIFEQIRIADENNDAAKKQELKTHLYSFTPNVLVSESRKYVNIINWTGLMVLDFDHLATEIAIEFKQALFNEYKFIIAAWLSASKHGVRAIVKIPVCQSIEEFKQRFAAMENLLGIYKGFDPAPKNCILPMFLSYDHDLLQRDNYTFFTKKFIAPVPPIIKQYIVDDKTSTIEKIIYNKIQTITDSGHLILRAAAYSLGGYVSAGYICENVAIEAINQMINSHPYLSQKASVYQKTAKTMILQGQSKPIYLA